MPNQLAFHKTSIPGLWKAQRKAAKDGRGSFSRLFCAEEFRRVGLTKPIVQINHSINLRKGVVRGLHFQHPPFSEIKIVSCIRGKVFDVTVDIRAGSKTFLHYYGVILSGKNEESIFIPEGFAHGFQTLEDECELLYFHTEYFTKGKEGALNITDPRLSIDWPLPPIGLSERDQCHPFIDEDFSGICI